MAKKKKFLLIDSNALIHRAFHALPPLRTRDGKNIGAAYGFTSTLLKAINDVKPAYIAATYDLAAPTFRHKEYNEYKATRTKAPDELYEQIPFTKEILESLNIPIFAEEGYEADDLIGTLCKKIDDKKMNIETVIVTGDLDTLQLVDNNTKVYTLKKGIKDTVIYDKDLIEQKYGINPDQVIDYKALRGDPSDNIPGVGGIGEKTATDLIKKYKTLDGVYKATKGDKFAFSDGIKKKLLDDKDNAYLSQRLATIDLKAPAKIDIKKCEIHDFDESKAVEAFQKFEFKSLMPRLLKLLGVQKKQGELFGEGSKKQEARSKGLDYKVIDNEEKFNKFLKDLKKQKVFAFDTETSDLGAIENNLVGISFSWKAKEAYYIPVGHKKGEQINKDIVIEKLKPIFEDEKIKKVGHNVKYDLLVLLKVGIDVKNIFFDTMLASYIIDPVRRGHSLDNLAFIEFGHQMIPIKDLIGTGKKQISFANVDIERATDYSAEDADMTWRLFEVFEKRMEKDSKIKKLFYRVEMPLVKILSKMEFWGVKINSKSLEKLSEETGKKIEKIEKEIYKISGKEFNINSPIQLREILFEKLEISTEDIKKGKTGLSTAATELEKLRGKHKIIDLILEYRELTKIKSTYLDALPKLVSRFDGRVHTSYNQTVTATGRLSSSDPNLQNIPIRTDLGSEIRKAFIAEKGKKLLVFDYSQIELRVVASVANDKKMLNAFNNKRDIHSETAMAIFDLPEDELKSEHRRVAKVVNFGIIYGISPYGLSQSTGIEREDAVKFIKEYFEEYPAIKKYMDDTIKFVEKERYVETLLGRRRYIPDIHSGVNQIKKAAERMAINMPIQGTAADIMKLAMIEIDEKVLRKNPDVKMISQVHDELVFEVPVGADHDLPKKIKEIMEGVYKLKCPIVVDSGIGNNWGEAK